MDVIIWCLKNNTNDITTMNDIILQQILKLHDEHTSNETTQPIRKFTIKKLCRKKYFFFARSEHGTSSP